MDLGNGLGHLTYSTLVHPADDWAEMWNSLTTYLPEVKARFAGTSRSACASGLQQRPPRRSLTVRPSARS